MWRAHFLIFSALVSVPKPEVLHKMALYRIFHRNSLPNSFTRHMMNLTPRKSSVPLKTIEIPVVFKQIHSELEVQNGGRNGKLLDMATYYFDGQGKAIRPSIVVNMGSAICAHLDRDSEKIFNSHMKVKREKYRKQTIFSANHLQVLRHF